MHMQARNEASASARSSEGDAARWNAVRCRPGGHKGHVESYFLKLNDPEGRRALWLKATILIRAGGTPRVAEAWAIAFDREGRHVAAKQSVGLQPQFIRAHGDDRVTARALDAQFGAHGLDIRVADLHLEPGRVWGSVASGDHRIAFDLKFSMEAPPLIPFPTERMYESPLPSSKLVSPHPNARFNGTYSIDGRTIEVDGWRGMQGHNWGTQHAELYAWAHVNQWEGDPDLVLEGVTARVKAGPMLAPPLTLVCVRYRGVRYDFNGPRSLLGARGTIDPRRWTFTAKTALATISGELWAETDDFVGLVYENPNGEITHCLNSKIARGRVRLSIHGRPDVEAITRAAALEIGTKDLSHGIEILA